MLRWQRTQRPPISHLRVSKVFLFWFWDPSLVCPSISVACETQCTFLPTDHIPVCLTMEPSLPGHNPPAVAYSLLLSLKEIVHCVMRIRTGRPWTDFVEAQLEVDPSPPEPLMRTHSWTTPWLQLWDPKERIQLSSTQTLGHRHFEIINVCCFKMLSLWQFVMQHRQLTHRLMECSPWEGLPLIDKEYDTHGLWHWSKIPRCDGILGYFFTILLIWSYIPGSSAFLFLRNFLILLKGFSKKERTIFESLLFTEFW